MAITNASDLLVYAKTTSPDKQKTRIRVLTATPLLDFENNTNIILNNVTNASGVVTDGIVDNIASTNTGSNLIASISLNLVGSYGYTDESGQDYTDGDYTYRDFQNGANGIVPTLEITNGTATFEENGIIIEIVTPGSSAIFDPVAYSTQASFSTSVDLRDVTTKDSGGYSESKAGLKSFEISTELLQSVNPDVPLDGTDFFHELSERDEVNVSFSDRIRNIIRTNLTQIGVDGFMTIGTSLTQDNLQADPFGGNTASKIIVASGESTRLQYLANAGQLANKKIAWSFYVKGTAVDKKECKFNIYRIISGTATPFPVSSVTWSILEGQGTLSTTEPANAQVNITGLSTSTWTRIQGTVDTSVADAGPVASYGFYLYPSAGNTAAGDSIFTSSWQIEFSPEATDYQDPTDITHWQGNALVSSVSFEAGVEDNLTCSATFTGTGNIYPNGLGPELIGDTGFDDPNYWGASGGSVVENGYGKIIAPSGLSNSYINKSPILVSGDTYLLTYTIPSASPGTGNITVQTSQNLPLLKTQGTHKLQFTASSDTLTIKRLENPSDIWLSSISLKKVL